MPVLPRMLSATDPAAEPALQRLNDRMAAYYNRPEISAYYAAAQGGNEVWPADGWHALLQHVARPGMAVLDVGCGSGHACENLASQRVAYTGLDWSREQVERNARRHPAGRFVSGSLYASGLPDASFDLVFSLYVLEHLVWPQRFLAEIARLARPGGLIFIECPHFRPEGRIPSLPYGRRIRPLSAKLKSGQLIDAAVHLYRRNVSFPKRLRSEYPPDRFPFLINPEPTCLGGDYYADNDAVYLVDRAEVVATLATFGVDDDTDAACRAMNRAVPRDPCVIVGRKRT